MAAPHTVLAVAVGDDEHDPLIDSNPPSHKVRPYIHGLINGLDEKNFTIGKDYVIEYRQRRASQLRDFFRTYRADHPDPSAIFCMSKRVVDAALTQYQEVPIVGIVSEPKDYDQHPNVCGFSARRFQTALDGYQNFIATVPSLSDIYVLSEKGYAPSDNALNNIRERFPRDSKFSPIEVDVSEGKDIDTELTKAHILRTAGIYVLPIDRCFGAADKILAWAAKNSVPTFWPVTDWVKPTTYPCALGGYGVSQELCGYRMADKLAHIWSKAAVPTQRFDVCQPDLRSSGGDFAWIASLNAYEKSVGSFPRPMPGLIII